MTSDASHKGHVPSSWFSWETCSWESKKSGCPESAFLERPPRGTSVDSSSWAPGVWVNQPGCLAPLSLWMSAAPANTWLRPHESPPRRNHLGFLTYKIMSKIEWLFESSTFGDNLLHSSSNHNISFEKRQPKWAIKEKWNSSEMPNRFTLQQTQTP